MHKMIKFICKNKDLNRVTWGIGVEAGGYGEF